jgi:ribosome maturation factor RimP
MGYEREISDIVTSLGLSLYDLELAKGTLSVVVDREGGIDVDALTEASLAISRYLDEADPIPGRYTLDVSSPGLERRLRTPAHFASAVGEVATLRERRDGQPTRRLEGEVLSADETSVTLRDAEAGEVTVRYSDLERARTVFHWGSTPKASPSRATTTTNSARRG